jgi:hypothetical protein
MICVCIISQPVCIYHYIILYIYSHQHRRVVTHRPEKKTHRSRSQALPLSQSTKRLHDFGLSCPGEPICSGSLRKWRSGIVKYYRWYRINTTCTNMNHIICNVCIYIHIYLLYLLNLLYINIYKYKYIQYLLIYIYILYLHYTSLYTTIYRSIWSWKWTPGPLAVPSCRSSPGIQCFTWHTVDGPAKSKSTVDKWLKHPINYRLSSIQGDAGCRNHPQYDIYIYMHIWVNDNNSLTWIFFGHSWMISIINYDSKYMLRLLCCCLRLLEWLMCLKQK